MNVFNRSENLCIIDKKFNLAKKSFLRGTVETAVDAKKTPKKVSKSLDPPIRQFLQAYYIVTKDNREFLFDLLLRRAAKSNNVLYWIITRILQENHEDFIAECGGTGQLIEQYSVIKSSPFADDPIKRSLVCRDILKKLNAIDVSSKGEDKETTEKRSKDLGDKSKLLDNQFQPLDNQLPSLLTKRKQPGNMLLNNNLVVVKKTNPSNGIPYNISGSPPRSLINNNVATTSIPGTKQKKKGGEDEGRAAG